MKEGMTERRKEEYRKEGKMEDKKTGKISVKQDRKLNSLWVLSIIDTVEDVYFPRTSQIFEHNAFTGTMSQTVWLLVPILATS